MAPDDRVTDYLAGLPVDQRQKLSQVNGAGLTALGEFLSLGEAVAFLGAGVSVPLYPLWDGLIGQLLDAASDRLDEGEAATCRALARDSPEAVVEIVRRSLGTGAYREVLREVLRVRTDPESGRTWTPIQELVCRCAFKAVVTTNYDPGIVDARMRIRQGASATGFTTWEDEVGLDRWRTGDVFGQAELPVLYAHGQHNQPDSIVLATTEYRRAYAGKLPHVLARLIDGHLAWIGFSFADQRIDAILRQVADRTGTRMEPGGPPRHVAIMAWDPAGGDNDPQILAQRAEIEFGALVVLYPAPHGDHGALALLLSSLVDLRFPAAEDVSARIGAPASVPDRTSVGRGPAIPVKWVPEAERLEYFTGRAEELARLDRWATDSQVTLIGVTAWGGAGKTALVTHWVQEAGSASQRPGIRGVFGWSFYADPSADRWAAALLEWAQQELGVQAGTGQPAAAVLGLLRVAPLLLVLDGLEVAQEGPAGDGFGRLLDGTLRQVLVGACQLHHGGLVMLTSRFPFADLETFDGGTARMLEVPPFTPVEGSSLLAAAGGDWVADAERRALVKAVDGHALAVGILVGLLADHLPTADLATLHQELAAAARTSARVSRVLQFYAERLSEPDRYLLAAVSLFARPVPAQAVLTVTRHQAFRGHLTGWTSARVIGAVRDRLGGLVSLHPDLTLSAHPLVRDHFRPLVLSAAQAAANAVLAQMPRGPVTNREDARRVVELIELLLEAGQWEAADGVFVRRTNMGYVFQSLPAARLGMRAGLAFVGTPARRETIASAMTPDNPPYYLNLAGMNAIVAGDLVTAQEYLRAAVQQCRDQGQPGALSTDLQNLSECLGNLAEIGPAQEAATEALTCMKPDNIDRDNVLNAHALLGWLADMSGDTAEAEEQFATAGQIAFTRDKAHLGSVYGTRWADFLARTRRTRPAQELTRRNRKVCKAKGWNDAAARCDRILGRLALAAGNTKTARKHLATAEACFRDGDYLTELAFTLTDLAEYARATGDLDAAERHATEAITIAAPRRLVPAQSAALAARARIHADQSAISPDHLAQGRDAADAALRLAARHHLAWHELDALRAHAALDQADHIDRGWAGKADARHAQLIPDGLAPDPLAAVERLVAAHKTDPQVAAQRPAMKAAKAEDRRRQQQRRRRPGRR